MFDTMMFSFMDALFPIAFLVILGVFVFILVQNVRTWNRNNHSPRLSVHAKVVAKRQDTSFHHTPNAGDASGAHGFSTSSSTSYYATFQVDSGDRMELCVSGAEYGMLAEGDEGTLSFQGTRYLGFKR